MESHVLNSYHHANSFCTIGHSRMKRISSNSESTSSESSSCQHTSPEYQQHLQSPEYITDQGNRRHTKNRRRQDPNYSESRSQQIQNLRNKLVQYALSQHMGLQTNVPYRQEDSEHIDNSNESSRTATANTTNTSQDFGELDDVEEDEDPSDDPSDDNYVDNPRIAFGEGVNIHNDSYDETVLGSIPHLPMSEIFIQNDDNSLVEGTDYEVIQVISVDPNLDVDDDKDDYVSDVEKEDNEHEDIDVEDECSRPDEYGGLEISQVMSPSNSEEQEENHNNKLLIGGNDVLSINFDAPVVTNVDEYFIKNIKEQPQHTPDKAKPIENLLPHTQDTSKLTEDIPQQDHIQVEAASSCINDSALKIEEIKRFLKGETKTLKNVARTPVSQFPKSNMVVSEARTSFTLDDFGLDIADLSFDKDKCTDHSKSDEMKLLTEEEISGFLINPKSEPNKEITKNIDDLTEQDMEIEATVEPIIHFQNNTGLIPKLRTSTPIPPSDAFCIEKTPSFTNDNVKLEFDEFVDIEAYNDSSTLPVLEANNLNSLLEQFEASEKLNTNSWPVAKIDQQAQSNTLANGMRQHDAGLQLSKNKMRQILMPSSSVTSNRVPSPVRSDHDYCTQKKRYSASKKKGGRSLLKPEVLSSNNQILSSRNRACKNKKIVYCDSSDDESVNGKLKNKKASKKEDSDFITKKCVGGKQIIKRTPESKNVSPVYSVPTDTYKTNNSVIVKNASKASDTSCSQSNGSLKLTIRNKSKVILNCDVKDSQKPITILRKDIVYKEKKSDGEIKSINNTNSSINTTKTINEVKETKTANNTTFSNQPNSNTAKVVYDVKGSKPAINTTLTNLPKTNTTKVVIEKKETKVSNTITQTKTPKNKSVTENKKIGITSTETNSKNVKVTKERPENVKKVHIVKEHSNNKKSSPKQNIFYTELFDNKEDVKIPQFELKRNEKKSFEEALKTIDNVKKEIEAPKKKKLNLQEYKQRMNSNNSSAQVSPTQVSPAQEVIFPDESFIIKQNIKKVENKSVSIKETIIKPQELSPNNEFDPIKEASRKIQLKEKKKVKAMRNRDEELIRSHIQKIDEKEIKPLISDAEMLRIVGMKPIMAEVLPLGLVKEKLKPEVPSDYEEIILVSTGTNTDDGVFKQLQDQDRKSKVSSSPKDSKTINFKIKKVDNILKQNVFDYVKKCNKSAVVVEKCNKNTDLKFDKERLNNITATLKRFEKQSVSKMPSNSLFSSIQDVVMKKAPEKSLKSPDPGSAKQKTVAENKSLCTSMKTMIVREYDPKVEHGEDKVILYLEKKRQKPKFSVAIIQTEDTSVTESYATEKCTIKEVQEIHSDKKRVKEKSPTRKRSDSDMSMSSDYSPVKKVFKPEDKLVPFTSKKRSPSPIKRSRSREYYEKYKRRSRSLSRRKYSRSRSYSKSPSCGRYKKYRKSGSPYRRSGSPYKQSRSPYRRSGSPYRRSGSPHGRPVSPYRRSDSSYRRSSTPYRTSRSPYRRSGSPYRRSGSPYRRSGSPYRRSGTPYRKTSLSYRRSDSPHKRRRQSPHRSRRRSPFLKKDYRSNKSKRMRTRTKSPVSKKSKLSPPYGLGSSNSKLSPSHGPSISKAVKQQRRSTASESSETSVSTSSSSAQSSLVDKRPRSAHYRSHRRNTNSQVNSLKQNNINNTDNDATVEDRRVVFVGKLESDIQKSKLRDMFAKFGNITEVRIYSKADGSRFGFVTFEHRTSAFAVSDAAVEFPQYQIAFGGRRAFCGKDYRDLDDIEDDVAESAFREEAVNVDSKKKSLFDLELLEIKEKLNQLRRNNEQNA